MTHPTLDETQTATVHKIVRTLKQGQSTSLTGPAGSGKSEIIRAVKQEMNAGMQDPEGATYTRNSKGNDVLKEINVLCCTPTHAARVVLNEKGLKNVFTIHASISVPKSKETEIEQKEKELADLMAIPEDMISDEQRAKEARILNNDIKELSAFDYAVNEEAIASRCNYMIVDESSMVNNDLAAKVNQFDKPVLWVGDTMQLPPVGSNSNMPADAFCNPYFVRADHALEKIYRQEGGSILRLASRLRKGIEFRGMVYGDVDDDLKIHNETVSMETISALESADMFIAHKNITVDKVNRILRDVNFDRLSLPTMQPDKSGVASVLPHATDSFVVTGQHNSAGLYNGQMISLEDAEFGFQHNIVRAFIVRANGTKIRSKATGAYRKFNIYTGMLNACYQNLTTQQRKDVAYNDRKLLKETDAVQVNFGRCVTVHKAQGRGEKHVVMIDDYNRQHDDFQKWFYTGVTRASQKLDIFI